MRDLAPALAVFSDNTAVHFTNDAAVVDEDSALADATGWTGRACLALVTRAAEAASTAEEQWPHVLCREDHFLEVVRAGTISLQSPVYLRISRSTFLDYEDLLWRDARDPRSLYTRPQASDSIRFSSAGEHGTIITLETPDA